LLRQARPASPKRDAGYLLPDEDKHIITTLLDAFLTKRQLQTLIR
jgi:hypothetical protein